MNNGIKTVMRKAKEIENFINSPGIELEFWGRYAEMEKRRCDNCNEEMKCSNYERHRKRCLRGKRFAKRKEGLCRICGKWKRAIRDHEKKCKGKPKEITYENCKKCYRIFSKSNVKRHEESCEEKHRIRRREWTINTL